MVGRSTSPRTLRRGSRARPGRTTDLLLVVRPLSRRGRGPVAAASELGPLTVWSTSPRVPTSPMGATRATRRPASTASQLNSARGDHHKAFGGPRTSTRLRGWSSCPSRRSPRSTAFRSGRLRRVEAALLTSAHRFERVAPRLRSMPSRRHDLTPRTPRHRALRCGGDDADASSSARDAARPRRSPTVWSSCSRTASYGHRRYSPSTAGLHPPDTRPR